jgi:hypothetical protein
MNETKTLICLKFTRVGFVRSVYKLSASRVLKTVAEIFAQLCLVPSDQSVQAQEDGIE